MESSQGRVLSIDGRSDAHVGVGILTWRPDHPPFASFYLIGRDRRSWCTAPENWKWDAARAM